MKNYKKLQRS